MNDVRHLGDDRLIDLAAQLLDPASEAETLRHLETCAPCEARFREICRDAEIARLRPPIARRAPRWRFAAVAASLLVVAATIALWSRSSGRVDPSAYWFPVDVDTVGLRTGGPETEAVAYNEAVEAYKRHDASRVVQLLRDRTIPEALDPVKIMLASAFVKTGEPVRAEALLAALRIETIPLPDRDRATWILFAALVAEGKTAEARALADSLAARPGEFADLARRAGKQLR